MNRDLKSIGYAFISCDLELYIPDDEKDCIFINKLVCNNCGEYWHTNLSECYFCGEINYYMYKCLKCENLYSITNAGKKCSCGSENMVKACINSDCLSNSQPEIKQAVNSKNGVFELKSSFNISLSHCVSCGNKVNEYKSYRVFIFNFRDTAEALIDYVNKKIKQPNDIILVKSNNDDNIRYDYISESTPENYIKNLTHDTLKFSTIPKLVENLYPIKQINI